MSKYPWDEMKEYFFMQHDPPHNKITLRDVSERFNVPYQTVRRVAGKENWHGDRAVFRSPEGISFVNNLLKRYEKNVD